MIKIPPTSILSLLVCCQLAGCISAPEIQQAAQIALPEQFSAGITTNSDTPTAWLDDFQSPPLRALIEEALAHNANLQLAVARLDQSISQAQISGAALRPQLAASVKGQRQQTSTFGPTATDALRLDNYDLGFNFKWEIDLWGRLRNQKSAARAHITATQAELTGARLSLAAQVCKRWFDSIAAEQQLKLAERIADLNTQSSNNIAAGFQLGLNSAIELSRARTRDAVAQAQVSARQRVFDHTTRSLERLLGRYPSASEQVHQAVLPPLPSSIPTGLPAELLQRRPDLIAAERQLAAVSQDLRATEKNRLPQISLTASGGNASQAFKNLLNNNFSVWSLAANLTQPIFQGGRIQAGIKQNKAIVDQASAHYHATILQALLEVESALAAEKFLQTEYLSITDAADQAGTANNLAWQGYYNGTSAMLTALEAQLSYYQTRSQMLQLHNRLLQNRIDLYLALGGPFQSES